MNPTARRWIGRAVVVLMAGTLASCGPRQPVIKIGFVAPLTGDLAAQGTDLLHGAELAIAEAAQTPDRKSVV